VSVASRKWDDAGRKWDDACTAYMNAQDAHVYAENDYQDTLLAALRDTYK
jgi:hypothetical protein